MLKQQRADTFGSNALVVAAAAPRREHTMRVARSSVTVARCQKPRQTLRGDTLRIVPPGGQHIPGSFQIAQRVTYNFTDHTQIQQRAKRALNSS
jgi:hypothetical protein